MHLGKEQSTGVAADRDDLQAAPAPATEPVAERDEREPVRPPVKAAAPTPAAR